MIVILVLKFLMITIIPLIEIPLLHHQDRSAVISDVTPALVVIDVCNISQIGQFQEVC